MLFFFFSSRRRHTSWPRDWSSDVCSSDLGQAAHLPAPLVGEVHAHRAGEAVLGGELGRAVPDEVEAGGHGPQAGGGEALPPADVGGRTVAGLVASETVVSQSRTPPRMACELSPTRTPGGRPLSFFELPPPSIT